MIAGVADTHTALWYLFNDARLSVAAGDFIDQAAAAGSRMVVSSISLAEIVYLIEKNRLPGERLRGPEGRPGRSRPRLQGGPLHSGNRGRHASGSPRRRSRHAGPHRLFISAFPSSAATGASAPPTSTRSGSYSPDPLRRRSWAKAKSDFAARPMRSTTSDAGPGRIMDAGGRGSKTAHPNNADGSARIRPRPESGSSV